MPGKKKRRTSQLSRNTKHCKYMKERRRNESLEARLARLAQGRSYAAMARSQESPTKRQDRLEANRISVAKLRESRKGRLKSYLFNCLMQQITTSKLNLDLNQQLDENFFEDEPTSGNESIEEKKQRLERNELRKALKNDDQLEMSKVCDDSESEMTQAYNFLHVEMGSADDDN